MRIEVHWWTHDRIANLIEDKVERAIRIAGEAVLERSQVYCPVDMVSKKGGGTLLRSGTVEYSSNRNEKEAIISYNTPYARVQHFEYPRKTKPGAKMYYLRDALDEESGRVESLLRRLL